MASKLEDEEYWNSTDTTGFSFNDDEQGLTVSNLFVPRKLTSSSGRCDRPTTTSSSSIFSDFFESNVGVKPLETLVSKKSLALLLGDDISNKGTETKTETTYLKRQALAQWEAPPPSETLRLILLGKPYSLRLYRSLDSKTKLLEEAIKCRDGNAILAILLFLSNTLKKKLVHELLRMKPVALSVYLNYLTTRFESRTAVELLTALGQTREAAMKDFQFLITPYQGVDKRLQNLKCILRDHFSSPDAEDRKFVENFIHYTEWQKDTKQVYSGTVSSTLSLLCSTNWASPPNNALSPQQLFNQLNVHSRLFHWIAINSRASESAWNDIADLILTKNWLGAKKLKTLLPVERIVAKLYKANAPEPVVTEYFAFVDGTDQQLELARKLAWHRAAIDTLVAMRDRQALVQYQANLNPQSNDYLHAESALRSNIKWKN